MNLNFSKYKILFLSFIAMMTFVSCQTQQTQNPDEMLIRISKIEVYPEYLDEYLQKAQKVGAISVAEEKGVICIYPMVQKRNPLQFRILEIYKDKEAYDLHIQSTHFQEYKTSTLHMVKSLDLVDMNAVDAEAMSEIFKNMP